MNTAAIFSLVTGFVINNFFWMLFLDRILKKDEKENIKKKMPSIGDSINSILGSLGKGDRESAESIIEKNLDPYAESVILGDKEAADQAKSLGITFEHP